MSVDSWAIPALEQQTAQHMRPAAKQILGTEHECPDNDELVDMLLYLVAWLQDSVAIPKLIGFQAQQCVDRLLGEAICNHMQLNAIAIAYAIDFHFCCWLLPCQLSQVSIAMNVSDRASHSIPCFDLTSEMSNKLQDTCISVQWGFYKALCAACI